MSIIKHYAIGDIHGRLDLLEKAFAAILKRDPDATIVMLGDYIDRGPDSAGCIRFLMKEQGSRKVICLKGNHEQMLVEAYNRRWDAHNYLDNGGAQTLVSYGHSQSDFVDMHVVPEYHIAWMDNLPTYHDIGSHVFVHAYMDITKGIHDQTQTAMLWTRYPKGESEVDWSVDGRHVVHGHTPHPNPLLRKGRTNLDVGAVFQGRLCVGVFGAPGSPEELIWVE